MHIGPMYDVGQRLFPDIQIMRNPISHINEIVLPLSNRILVSSRGYNHNRKRNHCTIHRIV